MSNKEEVQEQIELIEELRNELDLKNKCLSLISHDFKGLFSNIIWVLNAYEEGIILQDEFISMLPELRQNAKINLNTINDTFDWINAQNNTLSLQPKEIIVHELLSDLKDSLQGPIKKKNISFEYKGEPTLIIHSDKVILRFILKKLIENAIKYSYIDGEVEVETKKQGSFVCIYIKDKGMGISPDKLSTIFTLNGPTFMGTDNEKGVGLSLVIVNDFVKMMDGEIEIYQNTDNIGTIVELRFPSFAATQRS